MRSARLHKEQDYVIKFLNGLNEPFDNAKSQILLMDPLPTINKAFSIIIQQEQQAGGGSTTESQVFANMTEWKKGYGRGRGNGNLGILWKCATENMGFHPDSSLRIKILILLAMFAGESASSVKDDESSIKCQKINGFWSRFHSLKSSTKALWH